MPNSTRLTPPQRQSGVCVLIVDDNTSGAQTLQMMLNLDGYDVLVASNGRDAIKIFEGNQPQIVILDINLPDSDGYSVARAMRQMQGSKDTLIIALTGQTANDDVRESLEAGFDIHLAKPVNFDHLEKVIQERLAVAALRRAS